MEDASSRGSFMSCRCGKEACLQEAYNFCSDEKHRGPCKNWGSGSDQE